MKVEQTKIDGCLLLIPKVFEDHRGCFFETFNAKEFKSKTGISTRFIQDNESVSKKNVLRGLHFQSPPFGQAKLIRIAHGKILDVAVDCRPGSKTFGSYVSVILSSENKKQFYLPKGIAHGFYTLSETATVQYKCDTYYAPQAENGILYNDPDLAIDWQLLDRPILSRKDQKWTTFKSLFRL